MRCKKHQPRKTRAARWDSSGHLKVEYAGLQRACSVTRAVTPDPRAFLDEIGTNVSSGLQSGEQFLEAVTTAASGPQDSADQIVAEENGGPFLETSSSTEFSHGKDAKSAKERRARVSGTRAVSRNVRPK